MIHYPICGMAMVIALALDCQCRAHALKSTLWKGSITQHQSSQESYKLDNKLPTDDSLCFMYGISFISY